MNHMVLIQMAPITLSKHDGVTIPESTVRFSESDIQSLKLQVDPCGVSDNYGIDLYEQTLQFISGFTSI